MEQIDVFSKIYTRGLLGLHAPLIEVEVHVSQGLPSLTIVGLAEAAVRRVRTGFAQPLLIVDSVPD